MKMQINRIAAIAIAILTVACAKDEEIVPFEKQMEKDQAIIDQYLLDNGIDAQIDAESGLRYVIHASGAGKQPVLSTLPCVTFGYEGRLLSDGTEFAPRDTLEYPLHLLIAGFQYGLPLIAENGSITLYIPSRYGYGPKRSGSIPRDSNLIFDVDLLVVGAYNPEIGICE